MRFHTNENSSVVKPHISSGTLDGDSCVSGVVGRRAGLNKLADVILALKDTEDSDWEKDMEGIKD